MSEAIKGFINISTGEPAACDTEVTLVVEAGALIVRADCLYDASGVSPHDRLVIGFDPVGREADMIQIQVAPDGSVSSAVLGTAFPDYNRPAWGAEPYPFPAVADTALTNTGWKADVRLPLAAMFVARGGEVPETFRLNVGRNCGNREWSYWPLADATLSEFVPGFARVQVQGSGVSVQDAGSRQLAIENQKSKIENLPFVGLMYDTSRAGKIYDADTFIQFVDWLAVCGCTHFMLYFEDGFRFKKHPGFARPEALDASDVRRIESACHAKGMDLILAVTSFGHMPGILSHPDYIHLAEDGDPWQLCPRHPDTYPFLGDLLDEIIPLSASPYSNVNCDESRVIGCCPKCRERGTTAVGKEGIFLDHLLWLHEKVKSHGKRMMMWSDHLLHMPLLVEKLPRDIVVLDWQYCNWATFPTLMYLKDQGFDVIGCPHNRYDNIRPMTLDCRRRGMAGVLDTIWESGDGGLGLAAPGIYLMGKLAQGEATESDEAIFAEAEALIWPGNPPGIAWKMLIDHNGGLTPELRAKLYADSARAIRRATPDPRFGWLARQLLRRMESLL